MEESLKEKAEKIDILERERVDLTSQYQNDKISDEIQINELKQKVWKKKQKTIGLMMFFFNIK